MSERARRLTALLLAIGISAIVLVYREDLARLAAYGYPGIFLITFVSSSTVILPVPGLALVFAAGASFNPLLVGLVAGIGAGLGEITGYLVGYSGRGTVENRESYGRVRRWMERLVFVQPPPQGWKPFETIFQPGQQPVHQRVQRDGDQRTGQDQRILIVSQEAQRYAGLP